MTALYDPIKASIEAQEYYSGRLAAGVPSATHLELQKSLLFRGFQG